MKNYKQTALAVMGMSAVLFAGNAMALTLTGTNVVYDLVDAELGLFGTTTTIEVSGDSLILAPTSAFKASSTGALLVPGTLNVTVTAKKNYQLTAFSLTESGGYTRSSGTNVGVTGTFTVLDGYEAMFNKVVSGIEPSTSFSAASGTWDAATNLAVPVAAGWGDDNGVVNFVKLTISNQLFVTGGMGEIWKNAVTVNTSVSPVPEAETYAMMLAGLGLVGFMARRTRIAV